MLNFKGDVSDFATFACVVHWKR